MKRVPCVSIILEDLEGDILLLLRNNKSTAVFPNHWTLIGGHVQGEETPEMAACHALAEETGLKAPLSFWRRYDRQHPLFIADQHIYIGRLDTPGGSLVLGAGQALQFFKPAEIRYLRIGYGFRVLLDEYFLTTIGNPHVHHP